MREKLHDLRPELADGRPNGFADAVAQGQAHEVAHYHGLVGRAGVHLGHGQVKAHAEGQARVGRHEGRAGAGGQRGLEAGAGRQFQGREKAADDG